MGGLQLAVETECRKGLGRPVTDPKGHPGRRFWEAAETSELLTLLTSQQEQQYPLLFQGWKPLDLDAQCTLAFP